MKITPLVRVAIFAGALGALGFHPVAAQVVEFRATIDAEQEVDGSTSPARGTAIMFYDVGANTFELMVSITGMANTATASHIHEAPAGVNGPPVNNLGGDSAYTRSGDNLSGTFRGTYGGDPLDLLQGGAYYNIHSAQFPPGEIRGQLIPPPVRLVSVMDVAQEQAAFPNVDLSGLNDFGGAVMLYDPVAHTLRLRMSLFNFNNPFTNSHFHNGAPGVSGGVALGLGMDPNAGGYTNTNGHISGSFDVPAGNINPITLLTGGTYLNFHSSTFPGGELRGQVVVSHEMPSSRLGNSSVRGTVGAGEQALILGINVTGPEPIRVLITAKGPSLSAFGISGAVANPRLALFDSGGRQIALNDDVGTVATGSDLAAIPGVPSNSVESALVVVLPPGNYTAIATAASGSGVALLEVTDLRSVGSAIGAASAAEDVFVR